MTPLLKTLNLLSSGGYPDCMLVATIKTVEHFLDKGMTPEAISREIYCCPLDQVAMQQTHRLMRKES